MYTKSVAFLVDYMVGFENFLRCFAQNFEKSFGFCLAPGRGFASAVK